MLTKIKKFLFSVLKTIRNRLSGLGLSKIPGISMVYDFLFRHFWSGPDVIEIQGSKMYLNVREKFPDVRETFQSYALNKIHEEATTDLFKKTVKEGDVIVDLGANIGYFTLLAAKLTGKKGRVYAFEPEPRNYNYLVKNIGLNNYDNVSAFQKAVSDRKGKTRLFICPYDTGHHTINQPDGIEAYRQGRKGEVNGVEIETLALDEYFKDKEKRIDVIKIDVEGAEALAISGMKEILKNNENIKIFLEFFPLLIIKMNSSPEGFIDKLIEDYRFSIFIIPDDYDASKGEILRINSADELMNFCKGEKDHLNLFLKR